jgi:5-methylcytosine-specific restriction enzyme A
VGKGRIASLKPRIATLEPPRQAWQRGPLTPQRRAGGWLQKERARLFKQEPLCRACAAEGRIILATIRDHIVPLFEGGKDVDENIQPLCRTCSDAKTHAESMRGRGVETSRDR